MALDVETIVRLIDAVTERGITRLEVESDGTRLQIERQQPVGGSVPAPAVAQGAVQPVPATAATATVEAVAKKPEQDDSSLHTMTSPMVGTYYASPSPTAEPYVRVGDRVKKGQVLCIVEAMKLMNEIESDISGTIDAVLMENSQPVEYGEALFRVRVN